MPGYLLRVRTQLGTWRLKDVQPSDTFAQLRTRLEQEHGANLTGIAITSDAGGKNEYSDRATVGEVGLGNGDMLYAMVDESKQSVHKESSQLKTIKKDGTIVTQNVETVFQNTGFRPGMMPLRNMKMHWTLNEFVALDEQFRYNIKAPEQGICKLLSIDASAAKDFQSYMLNFDFRVMRVGFMYGRFLEDNTAKVEFIYEPPQESTDITFTLLEDSKEDAVEAIAGMLGLQKVGWIFAHPTREKGFHFSSAEILFAAEQQLEACGGVGDTPFVTMKLTVNEENEVIAEAYQVSKQCMEMAAEGVLETSLHLGACAVNATFTAVVEGKETKEVDNNFFLSTTPIEQFESDFLVHTFPKCNRIDRLQSRDDIKRQLSKAGKEGWSFSSLLADFHLLLYLTNFLGLSDDLPLICKAVTDRDQPLDDGYQLLLRSIAGIE